MKMSVEKTNAENVTVKCEKEVTEIKIEVKKEPIEIIDVDSSDATNCIENKEIPDVKIEKKKSNDIVKVYKRKRKLTENDVAVKEILPEGNQQKKIDNKTQTNNQMKPAQLNKNSVPKKKQKQAVNCKRLNKNQGVLQNSKNLQASSNTKNMNNKGNNKPPNSCNQPNSSGAPPAKKQRCSPAPIPTATTNTSNKRRKKKKRNKAKKTEPASGIEPIPVVDSSQKLGAIIVHTSKGVNSPRIFAKTDRPLVELPTASKFYPPLQMPILGEDNLPLVKGPTGLPVHITAAGELIPYDANGKRIPIGPHGFYLPVDPMGRLYPHIISPDNQAVPIHMTADGVLRLPNSNPVPYGPGHQLPINIDGKMILIGPDSRPLHPCPNIPTAPPQQMPNVIVTPTPVQPVVNNCVNSNNLIDLVGKTLQKNNKTKNKKNKKAQNATGTTLLKNPLNSSVQETQTKSTKNDGTNSGCNVEECEVILVKNKGAVEQIVISSDEEDNTVGKNCDKSTKVPPQKETIAEKVKKAINSLIEQNYKPPHIGRFILFELLDDPPKQQSPNESPLQKNRVLLPFITPDLINSENKTVDCQSTPQEKTPAVTSECTNKEKPPENKIPVFTFDFAAQCDFTSYIINHLKSKISGLERQLGLLQNANKNLLEGHRVYKEKSEKAEEELRKVLLELQEKGDEIVWLKQQLQTKK